MNKWQLDLGANFDQNKTRFKVWAPYQKRLLLKVQNASPIPMKKDKKGYFECELEKIQEGNCYSYLLENDKEFADPVSRFLPKGPFGPTQIVDPNRFQWSDQKWGGIDQKRLLFYECHVGTFTNEGTFKAIIEKLPYLRELNVTCLELMPIAEFPGRWNWGYDGVSLFAPHHIYGTPDELKELVNACHLQGIGVCLDAVYNHFGPEGCFVGEFGPYWEERYHTPWGKAINYDDAFSDEVRHFILQNVLYWFYEYHIDALRLDALHAIFDFSATSFFQELKEEVQKITKDEKRELMLFAESDLNDSRLIRPKKKGGYEFDGLWAEDFHHSLHVAFTGEKWGYYEDFRGLTDLEKALKKGAVYEGQYSSYRKKSHGNSFSRIEKEKLIVFSQNHDQVGNRPHGDRLIRSLEEQKTAALIVLLSPYTPLLFMGQEYGETAPFEFFADFQDPLLQSAVYEGRKKEFEMVEMVPHPDAEAFLRSKLQWEKTQKSPLLAFYKRVIEFRNSHLVHKEKLRVFPVASKKLLAWSYPNFGVICNFGEEKTVPLPFQSSQLLFHSEEEAYGGTVPPRFNADDHALTMKPFSSAVFLFL